MIDMNTIQGMALESARIIRAQRKTIVRQRVVIAALCLGLLAMGVVILLHE